LQFPAGMGFLLMREHDAGPVVAELGARTAARTLSVRPGLYFVRGRGADVLYEGALQAAAGAVTRVDLERLQRIEYARLVRKGGRESHAAHGFEAGARIRSPLPNADTPCIGGFVGHALDLQDIGVRTRLSLCTSGFENGLVRTTTNAYDLAARVYRAWDLPAFSLELGLGGGATLFTQHFEARGEAPDRRTLAPFLEVGAAFGLDLARSLYTSLDVAAETHFVSIESDGAAGARAHTAVAFALRSSLAVGKRF